MSDEENYYLFDRKELEMILLLLTTAASHLSSSSRHGIMTYDDFKKWLKWDTEIYLKNIIDNKNKKGEFVLKSQMEALVKGKLK